MGAGVSRKTLYDYKYRKLKRVESELLSKGVECRYKNLEVCGNKFVCYFAGIGPASNGERVLYMVLRYNPESTPSSVKKRIGDVDFTNFHTRDIPSLEEGGYNAGVERLIREHEKQAQEAEGTA